MLTVKVVDQRSGQEAEFVATSDEPLLDQMEEACPFEIPSLCWNGACGTCALRVVEGLEHLDPDAFGIGCTIEVEPGWILPCAAGAFASMLNGNSACRLVVGS